MPVVARCMAPPVCLASPVYHPDGNLRGTHVNQEKQRLEQMLDTDVPHNNYGPRHPTGATGDHDGASMSDPMAVCANEEYRHWNLDIRADKVTQLLDGESEHYPAWRDLMVGACS